MDGDAANHLNEAGMEVLLEFQAVTGMEDIDESRQILDRHNWDLLSAINSHMGFDVGSQQPFPPHMDSNHVPPPPPPHNNPQSPSTSRDVNRASTSSNNSNRVGLRSNNGGGGGIISWVWQLFTRPVEFFFRYVWEFIGFGLRFLRADPRMAITNPVQDVVDFIANYETKYGPEHPVFYQGTYSQALNDAKKELKFLLVYLHCDDHFDTEAFCRRVMPYPGFRDFVRENMLFWGCGISTPEGYRTSQALKENTYPFLALIVLKNHRMTVVTRIEGDTEPDSVLSRLHQGVADNEAFLIAERQDRLERSMTQTLRQQQDVAYEESLRADQEKERRKAEEKEKKRQEEMEKQRLEDEERNRREEIKRQKVLAGETLKAEPAANDPDLVRVVIKLPSGTRLERKFLKTDSLKHLYQFVFSHKEAPDFFEIATNFPKRNLPCKITEENPEPPTFLDAGLGRNEMLFVYDLES
ncbi:FAS-associated factor 2-B [Orchesella cincta]|uniref:FAS-associated factor 2-B n=1 Tax=Orchesella cincta TaxID=48709 RepID=A0A1D2NC87_ORCCI|nr:FAS-associated factor 2-B [Orchesella cincta]